MSDIFRLINKSKEQEVFQTHLESLNSYLLNNEFIIKEHKNGSPEKYYYSISTDLKLFIVIDYINEKVKFQIWKNGDIEEIKSISFFSAEDFDCFESQFINFLTVAESKKEKGNKKWN